MTAVGGMVIDMDIGLILKIAGVGFIVSVLTQILRKNGRDDQANFVSLAGIIIVLFMLIGKIGELIDLIQGVFGIV